MLPCAVNVSEDIKLIRLHLPDKSVQYPSNVINCLAQQIFQMFSEKNEMFWILKAIFLPS